MQITVLSATKETIATAKGSYQKLEVAYKDDQGQVKGKKIMSFGAGQAAFNALHQAQGGETFHITSVKNDAGFWDWTSASKSAANAPESSATASKTATPTKVATSNYETSEERAKRQVYIVRQSSITAALTFHNGKAKHTKDILDTAKEFENHVFGNTSVSEPVAYKESLDNDDISL